MSYTHAKLSNVNPESALQGPKLRHELGNRADVEPIVPGVDDALMANLAHAILSLGKHLHFDGGVVDVLVLAGWNMGRVRHVLEV